MMHSFHSIPSFHPTPHIVFNMMINSNPPLLHHYGALLRCCGAGEEINSPSIKLEAKKNNRESIEEEYQLPIINLGPLIRRESNNNSNSNDDEREEDVRACMRAIVEAASEWGFFQIVNHGVSSELLRKMRREEEKLFAMPFEKKAGSGLLENCYRWGSPTATCPNQFSWSEAFHIPIAKVRGDCSEELRPIRDTLETYAEAMSGLARTLAGILAQNLAGTTSNGNGTSEDTLKWMWNADGGGDEGGNAASSSSCFLRLNRYPPCAVSSEIFGLVPHTDSDLLTILYQDQVGGLQLKKDSKWVSVKPNKDALIVNIGDMFQAWSNDVYKSVEHKVMVNEKVERHSIAYFLCPPRNSVIGSCREPSIYRKFTFGEYRDQIQEDVKNTGHKLGLTRFLL